MAEQRLPIVDSDDGQWGAVLNQFIEKEHYNTGADNAANGSHKAITLRPGTTADGTAPIKFDSTASSILMTNKAAGAFEYSYANDRFYLTQVTGTARKAVATYYDDGSGSTGDVYYRDSNGNFVKLAIGVTSGSVLNVSGGLPAWGPATATTATVSTIALRDSSSNLTSNNFIESSSTIVTSGGTANLSVSSSYLQLFTGSSNHTIVLPDVTSAVVIGQKWQITNNSTGVLAVKPYGSSTSIIDLSSGLRVVLTCVSTSSNGASSWSATVSISKQIIVSSTDPSTLGTPAVGDVWIDTN